ncbi:MAG TPA: hypothetical protein VH951_13295 [Dehalococcoidia bacterium]
MSASRLILAGLCALAFLTLACKGGGGNPDDTQSGPGQPRPFLMGVSSVPRLPTDDAYKQAFQLAGKAGGVVLIQRAPPWSEFVPGGTISDRTQRLTRLERDLAKQDKVKLFLAIDATDPADRGRLAGLPDDLRGADFSDNRVRSAFISYAKYLALNYKPAYLALGVEVDMFFNRRGDAAFRNFQSLYFEAYDAVKSVSPSTAVFPTFQFEDLQAILDTGTPTQPTWSLVTRFEPKIDAIAVTSFPAFTYSSADRVPTDYYAALKARFQKPIILASVGWSSQTADVPSDAGEADQARFLGQTLSQAEALQFALVIWYLGEDVAPPVTPGFEPLATSGLLRSDGEGKAAWSIWSTYAARPYVSN